MCSPSTAASGSEDAVPCSSGSLEPLAEVELRVSNGSSDVAEDSRCSYLVRMQDAQIREPLLQWKETGYR